MTDDAGDATLTGSAGSPLDDEPTAAPEGEGGDDEKSFEDALREHSVSADEIGGYAGDGIDDSPEGKVDDEPRSGESAEPAEAKKEEEGGEPDDGPGDLRVALKQAREDHAKQVAAIQRESERRFNAMMQRFAQILQERSQDGGDDPAPPPDDAAAAEMRRIVREEIAPLVERGASLDSRRAQEAGTQLATEVDKFVAADYDRGVESYGKDVVDKAVEHAVGEEIRGIWARRPNATKEEVLETFEKEVLPAYQFEFASNGWSLIDQTVARAQMAGVLPQDLSALKAPKEAGEGKDDANTNGNPPESRVDTTPDRTSLGSVPGAVPPDKPSADYIVNKATEKEFNRFLESEGFDELLRQFSTPIS